MNIKNKALVIPWEDKTNEVLWAFILIIAFYKLSEKNYASVNCEYSSKEIREYRCALMNAMYCKLVSKNLSINV